MPVTIDDLAAYTKVSKATISRVLNNKPDVAPETVKRIKAAIEELGYVPSVQAVSLSRGQANCVGMLVPSLNWPLMLDLLRGVTETVETSDHALMLYSMTRSEESIRNFTNRVVRAKQIDGLVVLTPPGMLDYLEDLHRNGLTTIMIDDRGYNPTLPSVTTTNVEGAYTGTRHLIETGRRRIAFINGNKEFGCSTDRFNGYAAALTDAGLPVNVRLVYEGDFTEGRGASEVRALIDSGVDFDAIFFANDQMALGAMPVITRSGRRIPEDVAVVGFDDIYAAGMTNPSLTTVRQPFYEMGQLAANLLLKHLSGEPLPDAPIALPTSLVVRDSSMPKLEESGAQ